MDTETKTSPAELAQKPGDPKAKNKLPQEFGGPKGPEPTRFGDWENNGRCSDF